MLTDIHQHNFNVLVRNAQLNLLTVVACHHPPTQQTIPVLCMTQEREDGSTVFLPLAILLCGALNTQLDALVPPSSLPGRWGWAEVKNPPRKQTLLTAANMTGPPSPDE